MSNESLALFRKKVETDAKLQQALEGLFKDAGRRRVATAASIVDLAARHGFRFAADELKAHLAATGHEVELSEAEMDAVAGGPLDYGSGLRMEFRPAKYGDGIVAF